MDREAHPSPRGAAVKRPERKKRSLSFPCSELAEIELLILPQGIEQSQVAGDAVPRQRSQGKDNTGSSYPKRQT